jgi:hypothetical protein
MRSKEKLAASGMGFVEDVSLATVKAIGALEVLAAVGLILPAVLARASCRCWYRWPPSWRGAASGPSPADQVFDGTREK